ncbi:MAG: response regulator [Leptolyngbyaceae cyanobacterium T60_A2020_046]|nr:response regulator [Leptolyngbyaceae cyanobacterium T60_A2020_046]
MQILLVEDDTRLAESFSEALSAQRYAVDVARDGESAGDRLLTLSYDLVLMDVALPKLDGIQLCQRLRRDGVLIPVLMLTARDTSTDKVLGLDSGAG